MSEAFHDKIDDVIHQRVRLSIVSTLAGVEELEFGELKSLLGLTDGNLSTHGRVLETAGYVEVVKRFKGRKPQTLFRLTETGRSVFRDYVNQLEQILRIGRQTEK